MNVFSHLKLAARVKDAKLVEPAVQALRIAGYTDRECYRVALAGNPDLTEAEWTDLLPKPVDATKPKE